MKYTVRNITHYVFILFFFCFCLSCEKEPSDLQADYFVKFYGTYFNNYPVDLCKTESGGYVITGTSETELNGNDIFFIQTDKYGRQLGDIKYFGSESDERALCIEKLDNGYLIGGSATNSADKKDAVMLFLDQDGNMVGDMIVYNEGNDRNEEFTSIKKLNDGTYVLVGYSNTKFLIIKYDPVNNTFKESLADLNDTDLYEVLISSENRIISAGKEDNILNLVHIDQNGNYYAQDKIGNTEVLNEFADFIQLENGSYMLLSNAISVSNSKVNLREIEFNYIGTSDNPNTSEKSFHENYENYVLTDSNVGNSIIQLSNGNLAMLVTKTYKGDKNILLYILDEKGGVIGDPKEFGGKEIDQESVTLIADGESILILGINALENNSMITLIKADNNGNIWE